MRKTGIMALEGAEDIDPAAQPVTHAELQEIELASSQLHSSDHSPEFQELEQADQKVAQMTDQVAEVVQASTAMEAMSDAIARTIKESTLDIHGVRFANLAVEGVMSRYGQPTTRLAISVEDYKKDPKAALQAAIEDMAQQSEGLWASIKSRLSELANALKEKLKAAQQSTAALSKRHHECTEALKTIRDKFGRDAAPKIPVMKPQDWFIDICYLGKAPPKGLKGMGKQVQDLLQDTSKVLSSSVRKYAEWTKSNHDKALGDTEVFKTLRFKQSDFLVLNQKPLDAKRKIGVTNPAEGCLFYRSDELPGGKALVAHLPKSDLTGVDVIEGIGSVAYSIEEFDPPSYSRIKLAILAVIGVPIGAYLGWVLGANLGAVVGGLAGTVAGATVGTVAGGPAGTVVGGAIGLAGGAMGGMAGGAVYGGIKGIQGALAGAEHLSKEKDASGKKIGNEVKIDKDMVFETLSPSEADNVLGDVAAGIKAIQAWEAVAFKEVWSDEAFATLVDKTIARKEKSEEGVDKAAVRQLKNLCFGIFGLQMSVSEEVITYALRTYHAMLNYVQKSTYQYR